MKSVNKKLFDKSIEHAIELEKYSKQQVHEITTRLQSDVLDSLKRKIDDRVKRIQKHGYDTGSSTTARLRELQTTIEAEVQKGYATLHKQFGSSLQELGLTEAEFQAAMVRNSVPVNIDFRTPSPRILRSAIDTPFLGSTWFSGLSEQLQTGLHKELFTGLALGEPLPEITKRFQDVTGLSKRSMEGVVRTTITNVSSQARDATYAENSDLISGVQYVATLDSRTTPICRKLDGKVFQIGEGPRPPQHFRCRSTTVPVLKGWQDLGLKNLPPATRASIDGQVSETVTYPDWLKSQSLSVQEQALGKGVAKLFNEGRIKDSVFLTGKPITLKSLQGDLSVTKPPVPLKTVVPSEHLNPTSIEDKLIAQKVVETSLPTPIRTELQSQVKFTTGIPQQLPVTPDNAWVSKLTDPQRKSMDKWITDWRDMRNADLLGLPNKDLKHFKLAVKNALRVQTELHRSIILDREKADVLSNGKYFDNLAMSAYTDNEEVATKMLRDKVTETQSFIKIKGEMQGVDLTQFSQSEYLVDKGARLNIKSRKEIEVNGVKGWEVEVEQTPPPKRMTKEEWEHLVRKTEDYRRAIDSYTGTAYSNLKAVQQGKPDYNLDRLRPKLDNLQSVYEHAPLHTGTVYRGIHLYTSTEISTWTTVGNELELDSWTSFSKDIDAAKSFGNYVIRVESKQGMDISTVSGLPEEKEVLLPKGIRYKVVEVSPGKEKIHIILEELESEGLGSSEPIVQKKLSVPREPIRDPKTQRDALYNQGLAMETDLAEKTESMLKQKESLTVMGTLCPVGTAVINEL